MIDRVFTKAEARYIPNGPNSTADMAHPTRTGDVIAFSFPPYQFDAETPGTLVAPSQFFGQHGYVPAVQDLAANINMRATFLAGGEGIAKGEVDGTDDRPGADARVHARDPRAAAEPGTRPARRGQGRQRVQADLDRRADRLPRPARADDAGEHPLRRASRRTSAAVPSSRRCSTRSSRRCRSRASCWRRATTSARRRRTRPCSRTCRRSTSRTRGGSTPRRTATTSSTTASSGCWSSRRGRSSRSWRRTSSRRRPARRPSWVTPSKVFTINGVKVGVIGAELKNTPELVSAGATAGLDVPRRGVPDQGRVGAPPRGRCTCPGRRHPPGNQHR